MLHELAGQPAPEEFLTNIPRLVASYYTTTPDYTDPGQKVAFGTSGHRGTSTAGSFNQSHIIAIALAIVEYRKSAGIDGPLFVGIDTHALSEPAFCTALEVFAAYDVAIYIDAARGYTPTPVISHAILTYNRGRKSGLADGAVITPSHNPPSDGGFKYNPPNGGPADTAVTKGIENRANELLAAGVESIKRVSFAKALAAATLHDFISPYVSDLKNIIDMEAIKNAGIVIGVDPMGGSGIHYWDPIAERYGLDVTIVNRRVDPAFSFMPLDHDGKIRMDCSSPFAMAGLVAMRDQFDIAFGNDPDYDRHGIVTKSAGIMNPNSYLAVAIEYLFTHRPLWRDTVSIGKTLVSSSIIDKVAGALNRTLVEVPVGFKWFVDGLYEGSLGFGGEESSGASFLRFDGTVWSTDKDGIILDLLAAEITAVTGKDPSIHYSRLEQQFGRSHYARIDAPASTAQKKILSSMSPDAVTAHTLAGDNITAKLTTAPGNNAPIGGLKVVTDHGWFAARPSGTEEIYKIYAESLKSADHLSVIQTEARTIVGDLFADAGV